jgi:hypothetical protein
MLVAECNEFKDLEDLFYSSKQAFVVQIYQYSKTISKST